MDKNAECKTCIHYKVCWTIKEFGERLAEGDCENFRKDETQNK